MSDPLSDVVRLLQPRAVFANVVGGRGAWTIRYSELGLPSFCIVLDGSCLLAVDGSRPITISAGDFVLLPSTPPFTISSMLPAPPVFMDPKQISGRTKELRYGEQKGRPDMRMLGGSFEFDCADASLLTSLLPRVVHVQGSDRLSRLVRMVGEESAEVQPGGDFVMSRMADLLLVEAMRSTTTGNAPPGLLRGLGDKRLALVLRQLHARIDRPWTIERLAKIAALSRSAFFSRFTQEIGVAPMEYLLSWRMEIAKQLLRAEDLTVSEVAYRVGYGSGSAFSVAFSRYTGQAPGRYARKLA